VADGPAVKSSPEREGKSQPPAEWARLRFAAWLAFATHLTAGLAMAAFLGRGLETNPDRADRFRFLAEQTLLWVVAWLTWNAAALSILYFYAAFVRAHVREPGARASTLHYAILLSIVAAAADLGAEAIEIGVLPDLARQALAQPADAAGSATTLFLTLHRMAVMLTGYLANGLYTLAAVLLTWSTRRSYPAWVWLAGLAVGLSGLSLSAAALAGSTEGMFWANVVLMPCILTWQAGVALTAARAGGRETGRR
jgi:hypothetical protein